METPDFKTMSYKMFSEKYIEKHYKEFYNYLKYKYNDIPMKEKLYLYFQGYLFLNPLVIGLDNIPMLSEPLGYCKSIPFAFLKNLYGG